MGHTRTDARDRSAARPGEPGEEDPRRHHRGGDRLFLHVGLLWRGSRRAEKYVLLPLLLIVLAQFASGFPGVVEWADGAALRIVFLHLVLLGTVSVFLVQRALGLSIADPRRAAVASIAFTIAAWLLVFTILPLTSIYPGALRTRTRI